MKKRFTTKVRKTTASILVAITILASGGYTAITNIFGINKKDDRILDFDKTAEQNNSQFTDNIDNRTINQNSLKSNIETKNYQYKYAPQYFQKEKPIFEIETTEAISQTENINKLIRKRRKSTIEKVNIKNK